MGKKDYHKSRQKYFSYQQSSQDPSSWDHSYRGLCQRGKYHAHYTGLGIVLWEAHRLGHPNLGYRDIRHSHRHHDWSRLDPNNQLNKENKIHFVWKGSVHPTYHLDDTAWEISVLWCVYCWAEGQYCYIVKYGRT